MKPQLTSLYHGEHVISASDFNKEDLVNIFAETEDVKALYKHPTGRILLQGSLQEARNPHWFRILLWEPSWRTTSSFEDAIRQLGGDFQTTYDAGKFSSIAKGESIAKTIRMIGNRCHGIIIRHDGKQEKDALKTAADACKEYGLRARIINAGDENREHPTQAILDCYTIYSKYPEVFKGTPLIYGFVGDITDSRTIHSLLLMMHRSDFTGTVYLICEEGDHLPNWLLCNLEGSRLRIVSSSNILEYAHLIDVWYFTRYQFERKIDITKMSEEEKQTTAAHYARKFGWSEEWAAHTKESAVCLHPLPHNEEFPPDSDNPVRSIVEKDHRFIHLEQADNGFFTRMALLRLLYPQPVGI